MLLLTVGRPGDNSTNQICTNKPFLKRHGLDPTGGVSWQKERVKTRAQMTLRYALG